MSGVYIKGMQMPADDNGKMEPTAVWVYPNGYAIVFNNNGNMPQYTQAIPVPDHGDLIDQKALFDAVYKAYGVEADDSDCNILMEMILNAPAIIPGDKED